MSSETESNRPKWNAEDTHPELVDALVEALKGVTDPELGMSVIQLGLIRNVAITDESAQISMILTTPYCPYASAMLESTRKKAEETLGRKTSIEYGKEMWDFSMMEEGLGDNWGLY